MNTSKALLTSLLITSQKGQAEIRSMLDLSMAANLRDALRSQLREFASIETEAHRIASQRGWELTELEPAARFLIDRRIRFRLSGRNTDSKIADMMIQGNTKGLIRSIQRLNQFREEDSRVRILTQKLLDCENAGIRQMQLFL